MPSPATASADLPGVALFLDFDGTLVDIAERPEEVVVEPWLPDVLVRLAERLGGALALVSGRPIAFLDARLGPHRFDAAGLHGLERRQGGHLEPCRPQDHPTLRAAVEWMRMAAADHPGLLLEDKGCSGAIHWRLSPQKAGEARRIAEKAAVAAGPGYRLQLGKAVAEILPVAAGKGGAVPAFLAVPPYRGRRPVFIGDDLTDEDGFAAANAAGGISLRVGEGETVARGRIATPAALRLALAAWADGRPPQILADLLAAPARA